IAAEKLQALLALDPAHTRAKQLLQHAQTQQNLAIWYNQARKHIAASRWQAALDSLRRVHAADAGYRDVHSLIRMIERDIGRPSAEPSAGQRQVAAGGGSVPPASQVEHIPAERPPAIQSTGVSGTRDAGTGTAMPRLNRTWLAGGIALTVVIVLTAALLLIRRGGATAD